MQTQANTNLPAGGKQADATAKAIIAAVLEGNALGGRRNPAIP